MNHSKIFLGLRTKFKILTSAALIFLFSYSYYSCGSKDDQSTRSLTNVLIENCGFIESMEDSKGIACGYIEVPENHDAKDGKSIYISYVVIFTQNPNNKKNDPVIFLSGGPGGSSLSMGAIEQWKENPINKDRDIILFDQRGIGHSSPLPNMNIELRDVMAADLTEEEELTKVREVIETFQLKCAEETIIPANYNSFQSAKDVGLLMDHLGYTGYNLIGVSYGTRLGRIVQDLYPDKLNSVILNSPNPIDGDFLIDRLNSYSLALNRVFDYCKSSPDCHSKYPDLRRNYLEAIEEIKSNPLIISADFGPFVLNAQDAIYFLRRLLYRNNSREIIPQLIYDYKNGDANLIEDAVQHEFDSDYNFSMWISVERFEQYNINNDRSVIDLNYEDLELFPARLGLFDPVYTSMRYWHNAKLSEELKNFKESSVPTMIMVNQYDPVTPPENGHLFMKDLTKGQLYILDEGGHGGGSPECRDDVVGSFMNYPHQIPDISCLKIYKGL